MSLKLLLSQNYSNTINQDFFLEFSSNPLKLCKKISSLTINDFSTQKLLQPFKIQSRNNFQTQLLINPHFKTILNSMFRFVSHKIYPRIQFSPRNSKPIKVQKHKNKKFSILLSFTIFFFLKR